LVEEYIPCLTEIRRWCELKLKSDGQSFSAELKPHERTLSPSDFGFHNALRRPTGQIVFVDFEYFGWDDPAKMISDFLLHPAMDLSDVLKGRFLDNIFQGYQDYPHLAGRVAMVYSLWALKWCLILLNEFVPEHLGRRGFASERPLNESELQSQQLSKARRMLRDVMDNYQHFPYQP
jgi:thiamine kinase-like enzyme